MKKRLAIWMALLICLGLSACGRAEPASLPETPAPTAAAEEPAASAAPSAPPAVKIGMVTDAGSVHDLSFGQTAWEGLRNIANENEIYQVEYRESASVADYSADIQAFIDDDYDLIICLSYLLADATRTAAEANPEQLFVVVDDDFCADLPNVACLLFSQEQSSYLVGIIAGLATKTNVVGYVQGGLSDTMNRFGVGFIAGVRSANPNAVVLQCNTDTFSDPAVGAETATQMIAERADVIYTAAGATSTGVIEACAANGIYAIGIDTDQNILAPENVITSAMKRVDTAVQDIARSVKEHRFTPGVHLYSMKNDGVGIAPSQHLLTQEMLTAVDDAMADVFYEYFVVPVNGAELEELFGEDLFTLDDAA